MECIACYNNNSNKDSNIENIMRGNDPVNTDFIFMTDNVAYGYADKRNIYDN